MCFHRPIILTSNQSCPVTVIIIMEMYHKAMCFFLIFCFLVSPALWLLRRFPVIKLQVNTCVHISLPPEWEPRQKCAEWWCHFTHMLLYKLTKNHGLLSSVGGGCAGNGWQAEDKYICTSRNLHFQAERSEAWKRCVTLCSHSVSAVTWTVWILQHGMWHKVQTLGADLLTGCVAWN